MADQKENQNPVVDAVIPVYKPDERFVTNLWMLKKQACPLRKIILMITVSEDAVYPDFDAIGGIEVHEITPAEFDHGKTRNEGASYSDADYLLYLTQDALPADTHLVSELLEAFREEKTGAAYARQLPRPEADIPEALTRTFNYPEHNRIQNLESLPDLGVKTYFCSNAAAMYDRKIFAALGGFVNRTIFNEDMIYAYKLVQAGYTIRYVSAARVFHSHEYTGEEQFHRNFDLGVSQADHPEIFETVSSEKEGASLVKTVVGELLKRGRILSVFSFGWNCFRRYCGYRLGKRYRTLSEKRVRRYSLNKKYWESYYGTDQSNAE